MARPLIVEPGTERLQVVLMRGCATVDAADVTLTVTRKGEGPCRLVPPCVGACAQTWPRAHDVPEGRWGGCDSCDESNCSESGKRAPTLAPSRRCDGVLLALPAAPLKIYLAESVVRGVVTFVIDEDLIDAPEGWYLGRVTVAGCLVAMLTVWVRSERMLRRAGPILGASKKP